MSHARTDRLPNSLAEWRDCLCDKEMPIFSGTVRRIGAIVDDAKAGPTELAHIVMADPSLSAKVLRLGNSACYNPGRQPMGTLTKAIVLLGAKVVNELALTASYIEAIQSAKNRRNANREIVDALHAAVQAKSFAQLCRDPAPEEVFLAALLYNIGHVAFWCFEERFGEQIDRLIQDKGLAAEEAERQVLGFRLRELGAALAKAWQLKGLVAEVHQGKGADAGRIRLVQQAHEAVKLHNRGELEAVHLKALLAPLEKASGKGTAELLALVEANTHTTATIAAQYGVENATSLLLVPRELDWELEPQSDTPDAEATVVIRAPLAEDGGSILQSIQQDISSQLSGDFDLNALFEMVIEGIQRGIPMERALFALLNQDRSTLREKSAIGWPSLRSRAPLEIPIADTGQTPNIFTYALQGNSAAWIRPADGPKWSRLYTPAVEAQFGRHACFIAPLAINGRPIGAIYADRGLGGAPPDQGAFNTFCHLAQQANFGLKLSQLQR